MLIKNGTVLTFGKDKRMIPGGAVYYEGDTIMDVGFTSELTAKYPNVKTLDAQGKLIMPGMVCGHTHFYGAFARGMAIPGHPPQNFMQILEQLWWKIDRALTLEDSKASAEVCLIDAIRHGTTTLIDHHASPNAIDGSLDVIGEAVLESGLRASLCYEVTDRNGEAGADAGIAENVRWIKKVQALRTAGDPNAERLGASFGMHANFTVDDRTLDRSLAAANGLDTGFHIHVAEDKADQQHSLKMYNKRILERLEDRGVLGAKTLVAHAIHIDEFEMGALKNTRTKVSHQPRSNMNNAVGVAKVERMLQKGITIGLGNDGFSNNMFTEMAVTYLLHKSHQSNPQAMGGYTVMDMAFDNNAKIAKIFFPKPVAALEAGAYADIILLDYYPFTEMTDGNFPWHILFGMDGSRVTHTIASGKMLMKDRALLHLDEQTIAAHAKKLAGKVWDRVLVM